MLPQIDSGILSTFFIATVSLLLWVNARVQARDRNFRKELKWRREQDPKKNVYIRRLEKTLDDRDIPYPPQPPGIQDELEQDWTS